MLLIRKVWKMFEVSLVWTGVCIEFLESRMSWELFIGIFGVSYTLLTVRFSPSILYTNFFIYKDIFENIFLSFK